jgi:hypothetical protein
MKPGLAALVALLLGATAGAEAHAAPGQDTVTVTGGSGRLSVSIEATSGPDGEGARGTVRFGALGVDTTISFDGSVTCLAVSGTTAVVAARDTSGRYRTRHAVLVLDDLGPPDTGFVLDRLRAFTSVAEPPDCRLPPPPQDQLIDWPLRTITVHDAVAPPTRKHHCHDDGWRPHGLFADREECEGFVAAASVVDPRG